VTNPKPFLVVVQWFASGNSTWPV